MIEAENKVLSEECEQQNMARGRLLYIQYYDMSSIPRCVGFYPSVQWCSEISGA